MSSTILVTGAPGNVGTPLVNALQAAGADFRIGAHNTKQAAAAFGTADSVHFDFLDPQTFPATFQGIKRMFLVRPPTLANVKRDIAPAIQAAVAAGVERIVFLSLQGVEKNRMVPHHKIEQLLDTLPIETVYLRASFFMQNLSTTHCAEIRDRAQIAVPVGRALTSFIDTRDIGAVAARTLIEDAHVDAVYTLTGGEALDYYQVAALLSAELNRPIRYTNPSVLTFLRQQVTDGRKFGFALIMAGLYTITRMGVAREITPDVQQVLGRAPIRFAQFAHDHRQVWNPA